MKIKSILLIVITVLVVLTTFSVSCSKKATVSKEVEAILENGIIGSVDLSLSPLDELALPTAEMEIPPIELPDIDMSIDIDFSGLMP